MSGGLIAIHQPEYFPWLGFLDKARQADVLVLLDSVQFDRASLQHRAKVLGSGGVVWLTIPYVHRFPQRIDEVSFADARWPVKHQKTIQACYGRAPGYAAAKSLIDRYFAASYSGLAEATIQSCLLLLDAFNVRPAQVVRASTLGVTGEKAELVLRICQNLGASRYLSGRSGATYLDAERMAANGVELTVQRFEPRAYGVRSVGDIVPGLSALDALMCLGEGARNYFTDGTGA